jgi:signal peptidase II
MIYAIVAVLVLILDQAVKYWTVSNITLEIGRVPLIDGLVHLTHVRNYGAAFSILQNTRWLLVALTVVFVAAIIYALCAELIHGAFGRWTALLLLAGAIGNGIDRLFVGYVVDMIEVEFISFPVFNIADIFVTVFGVLFCVYIVFHRASDDERATERSISRDVQNIWEQEDARHTAALEDEDDAFEDTDSSIQVAPWQIPVFNPDQPFAEWEDEPEQAKKPFQKPELFRPVNPAETIPAVDFNAPEPAAPAPKAPVDTTPKAPAYIPPEPAAPVNTVPAPKAPVQSAPVPKTPVQPEPKPKTPVQPEPKPKPAADDMEFDLESILAEFKD